MTHTGGRRASDRLLCLCYLFHKLCLKFVKLHHCLTMCQSNFPLPDGCLSANLAQGCSATQRFHPSYRSFFSSSPPFPLFLCSFPSTVSSVKKGPPMSLISFSNESGMLAVNESPRGCVRASALRRKERCGHKAVAHRGKLCRVLMFMETGRGKP